MTGALAARACVVGVDIGGTFTDVVLVDAKGRLTLGKSPTTPEDPPSQTHKPFQKTQKQKKQSALLQ